MSARWTQPKMSRCHDATTSRLPVGPCVYMLRGTSGRHYIGATADLARRLRAHQSGWGHTTRRLGLPLVLVASIALPSMAEAFALEFQLKRLKDPRSALQKVKSLGGGSIL